MKLELDKNFKARLKKKFETYSFEVGVLEDAPHREALRGQRGKGGKDVLTEYAGGPVRRTSRKSSIDISEVGVRLSKFLGFNFLTKPFEKSSPARKAFFIEFCKFVFGKSQLKRVENALQAVVRNPMLRGDYGNNSKLTQKIKGFNRLTIDTGQLFKAITARVNGRKRGGNV